MDKQIAVLYKMKGVLDDDYTLFESGKILHEFDKHIYPGGQNFKEELIPEQISNEIKIRLLDAASEEDKERVKEILGIV